jgi:hypothetical protein
MHRTGILNSALVAMEALLHRSTEYAIPFAAELYGIPAEVLLGALAMAFSHALWSARLLAEPWYAEADRPPSCSRNTPLSFFS